MQSSAGVPLAGISRLRKNDRRTYGEVIGLIWLQTSCQVRGQRPEIRPTDHGEQVLPIANLGILREFSVDEASDLQEY